MIDAELQALIDADEINFISTNKSKPKKEEVFVNGKKIQITEISDDGRIIVTKTNASGL